MPQLDIVTFVNQYMWIISSITGVIIITLILVLPSMKKLTEIREDNFEIEISLIREKDFVGLKRLIFYV